MDLVSVVSNSGNGVLPIRCQANDPLTTHQIRWNWNSNIFNSENPFENVFPKYRPYFSGPNVQKWRFHYGCIVAIWPFYVWHTPNKATECRWWVNYGQSTDIDLLYIAPLFRSLTCYISDVQWMFGINTLVGATTRDQWRFSIPI